jgi:phosphoglycolate phosphatase-like HAD superfamily hydrolase
VKAILVDIDGTLADLAHRLHYIQAEISKDKNWPAFFDACSDDAPIHITIEAVRAMASTFEVVFVTGRPDSHEDHTRAWLDRHVALVGPLYMRKAGDYREDRVVKRELLALIREHGYEPVIAIDDRRQVVDMWREEGLICLQCAAGEY